MKELIEKKNDLITRAEEILNKAKEETRELTEEEIKEVTEIREQVKRIDETVKADEEIRAMEIKEAEEKKEEEKVEEEVRSVEQMEEQAFENYVRGRIVHERAGELTPATEGSSIGLGGALIPKTIVNRIIQKVYDLSPVLARSQKFNVKGTLEVPYYPADSDNITVAYQTEFSPMSSSTGSFATISLTGYLAGALTKISRTLINNVNFNIVGFIVDEMGRAIARFIEKELLIGTPDTAHAGANAKVLGLSTLSNKITAASTSAITADEIVQLHDKIKDQFQQNAIWIMSSATRTALRLLQTQDGRYLLNDDISTPFGTSLLGKPIFVSDNMEEIGAGKTVIYYGDMRGLATKFNEQINIEVLREKYADEHAVGVVGWFEFDSKVIDEQQIAKLVMKAS